MDHRDGVELSMHDSSDAIKYSQKDISGRKRRMRKQNTDSVVGISMCTASRDDEYTGKGSDSVATQSAGKTVKSRTREILWLKFLMRFCTEVSVLGLRYVVNTSASMTRRSIWLLLVLAGAAFTAYQIQNRIRYYFTHPVNVIIWEEHMQEIEFPTVTICSENRISLSAATSYGKCWNLHNFCSV